MTSLNQINFELVAGSALIIWGLAYLFNKDLLKSFYDMFLNIEQNKPLIHVTGYVFLFIGLFTLWFYGYWRLESIVTILGWIITIESSLLLLCPRFFAWLVKKTSVIFLNVWFRIIIGGLHIILGLSTVIAAYKKVFQIPGISP